MTVILNCMVDDTKEWMKKAKSDLKHAASSFKMGDNDWAEIAAQQSAEKALKSVCIKVGLGLIRTHDLTLLARKLNAPNEIIFACGLLNPFYTASRYPDAEEPSTKDADRSAARTAVSSSKKVLTWCKKQTISK